MLPTSRAADAGIDGTISVSPSRPGPLHNGEEAKAPVANMEFIVFQNDKKLASFTTDAQGHFHITLPPGHYVVKRQDAGSTVGRWSFEADVVAGEIAKVNWTADSGMR